MAATISNAALLNQALLAAGLPVVGVADTGGGTYRIDYDGTQTPAQITTGLAVIAALNLTAQLTLLERSTAQALLTDPGQQGKAFRAVLLVTFNYINTTNAVVNQLVAFSNTKGATITPLSIPTVAQAYAALQAVVAAGQAD